ncbi:alpha-amylase-2 [Coleophoma crateriformis]|uniref:Alpha-amylase n=1 Tax=Coleophoma crateriformis TaxID=565419 RepID=A0A3D8QTT7_9HELO|nr:alpha-amylase-2 [Coleophoma crateriformis]
MANYMAWKERSIYQVLTDRFAVAGHGNSGPQCDPFAGKHCGGTWRGIIEKLDYIQGMGFDAVWISPITKNLDDTTLYGEAYHGYWQDDLYSVNCHFGTTEDLLALSDALHDRGMFLMVDVIVNHMGSLPDLDFSRLVPFNDASYFHPQKYITNYGDQCLVEQGWLGDSKVPLPDLDTENPTVVRTLYAWINALVQKFGIDGLRIDAAKHIRKDFWPGFIKSAGVWSVGEVLSGDPGYLGSYQPYVGGLLDYGTLFSLKRAFKAGIGNMYELSNLLNSDYRAHFPDVQQMATFMENHDMARFTSDTNADLTVIMNALAWTFLADGIPVLYYGQEQSYTGENDGDPESRDVLWRSGYKTTLLYKFISLLNRVRKVSWKAGYGTNLATCLYAELDVLATQKGPLIMVLSNQGSHEKDRTISFSTKFSDTTETTLVDLLTNEQIVVKNSLTVTLVAGQPRLYLPLQLASQVCSSTKSPQVSSASLLVQNLSGMKMSSANVDLDVSQPAITWSLGAPANTHDILNEPLPLEDGLILTPAIDATETPYSMFTGISSLQASSEEIDSCRSQAPTSHLLSPSIKVH